MSFVTYWPATSAAASSWCFGETVILFASLAIFSGNTVWLESRSIWSWVRTFEILGIWQDLKGASCVLWMGLNLAFWEILCWELLSETAYGVRSWSLGVATLNLAWRRGLDVISLFAIKLWVSVLCPLKRTSLWSKQRESVHLLINWQIARKRTLVCVTTQIS